MNINQVSVLKVFVLVTVFVQVRFFQYLQFSSFSTVLSNQVSVLRVFVLVTGLVQVRFFHYIELYECSDISSQMLQQSTKGNEMK
jgi:hypothetical protein